MFSGSALVYVLIFMMVIAVSALSLAVSVLVQKRGISGTNDSIIAFQVANSGIEDIIGKIERGESRNWKIQQISSPCSSGEISGTVGTGMNANSYTAYFVRADGNKLGCNDRVDLIEGIKVSATVGNSSRAVEMAYAGGKLGVVGGCLVYVDGTLKALPGWSWGAGCENSDPSNTLSCSEIQDGGYSCGPTGVMEALFSGNPTPAPASDALICICIKD